VSSSATLSGETIVPIGDSRPIAGERPMLSPVTTAGFDREAITGMPITSARCGSTRRGNRALSFSPLNAVSRGAERPAVTDEGARPAGHFGLDPFTPEFQATGTGDRGHG
jgi:hypothetical protein